ncbi:MAG: ribosomal RNA small subunit methyltransferase A [Planctomycetes bacterium]|nr:ribosomal RNA small subunit methyltransferase A [Planctomycetota bacterium]
MFADGFLEKHLASVRAALRARAVVAKKRLSQNFLLDAALLRRIVATAGELRGREVVEIGPGPGGLTAALLEAGANVTAIELDPEWARATALALVGRGTLDLRVEDALATATQVVERLAARGSRSPLVISNLPYAIASPLLVDLVRAAVPPERIVVMVQREVADRMVAAPGAREMGLLTLLIQLRATVKRRFVVPAGAFVPPPKVDSAIAEIVPDTHRRAELARRPQLEPLIRAAFQARRKTLRRGLLEVAGDEALQRVDAALLKRRPEELSLAEWYALADALTAAGAALPAATTAPAGGELAPS